MLMRYFKQRLTFLFTEGYTTPKYDTIWHGGDTDIKASGCFCQLCFQPWEGTLTLCYRNGSIMLMRACPVKNTFAVGKHFGFRLGS